MTASMRSSQERRAAAGDAVAATGARPAHRGALVVMVGPDGVGKTTISRALAAAHRGPAAYFHFVPPILEPLASAAPVNAAPHLGKGKPGGSRVLGCLRLARNAVRYWIAYIVRVRPAVKSGTLVIGDRGMYGYLVQPLALKFHGPNALARFVLRLLPRPALIVNLSAPARVIRSRKQELTIDQIERELEQWRRLSIGRVITIDATATPQEIARRVMTELAS